MTVEDQIIEAMLAELERQIADPKQKLSIKRESPPFVRIEGRVDLDKLAMVVMGKIAGGP